MDMRQPAWERRLELSSSARDVRTTADGAAEVVAEVSLVTTVELDQVGNDGVVRSLTVDGARADLSGLVGDRIARGFRASVRALGLRPAGDHLTACLLDLVPIGGLLSGYAEMWFGGRVRHAGDALLVQAGACAGWKPDGPLLVHIGRVGKVPTPSGAPAPALERDDDPEAWHTAEELETTAMRRALRLDVVPADDGWRVDAMFRDTLATESGTVVLHEYRLDADLDPDLRIERIEAEPRVLPWTVCVSARRAADHWIGHRCDEVPDLSRDLRGVATCTHLNDLLRGLAWVPELVSPRP